MERTDVVQRDQIRQAPPIEEMRGRPHVGRARVGVADRGGEEFEKVLAGVVARVGDDRRNHEAWPSR